MARRVKHSSGFTLIEVSIAILIIMVSMLAALTMITLAMRTSLNNDLRDVSTVVANQTGEALLALPMTDSELTSGLTSGVTHTRITNDATQGAKGLPNTLQIVRGAQTPLTIQWQVFSMETSTTSPDSLKIVISVGYVRNNQNISTDSVVFKHKTI